MWRVCKCSCYIFDDWPKNLPVEAQKMNSVKLETFDEILPLILPDALSFLIYLLTPINIFCKLFVLVFDVLK